MIYTPNFPKSILAISMQFLLLSPFAVAEELVLPSVEVKAEAQAETAAGPVHGYVAKRSSSGTKTDTAIAETAQSISVVSNEQMKDQGVRSISDGLRYTAGVLTEFNGHDLRFESYNIRGFDAEKYFNGLRIYNAGSYADTVFDTQALEKIDVIKGPSSVLYGQGSPGGIVNLVSKMPNGDALKEVALTIGNNQLYELVADVGGALNDEKTLMFRINGVAKNSKTQTEYSQDDRLFIAPVLKYQPSADLSLTILADINRDRVTPKSWYPNKYLLDSHPDGDIPVDRFVGEPDFDRYNRDNQSISYLFDYATNGWLFKQNARYAKFDLDYQHAFATGVVDQRNIERSALVSIEDGESITIDTNAQTAFNTGPVKHKVLLGVDYQNVKSNISQGLGTVPDLDVFLPMYGKEILPVERAMQHNKLSQIGFYVQDQMNVSDMVLNFGVRHDQAKLKYESVDVVIEPDNNHTSYNLGLLYKIAGGFNPYLSYSTSFSPVLGVDHNFEAAKAETAKQFEVGVKYQPTHFNGLFTLSLFEIKKQNVLTPDLDYPGFNKQTGEIRNKGLEFEAKMALYKNMSIIASYTYLDSKVTQSNYEGEQGKQPTQTAKNMASFWTNYQFDQNLAGFSLGAGARYVGETPGDAINSYYNPSFLLLDGALRYQAKGYSLSVNVNNALNKKTVANSGRFFGPERKIIAKLGYSW